MPGARLKLRRRKGAWYLTWGICYEFMRVLTHPRVLTDVAAEVPGLAGDTVRDRQTAVLMREYGNHRICTRDRDLHRFRFLEPVDPLIAEP